MNTFIYSWKLTLKHWPWLVVAVFFDALFILGILLLNLYIINQMQEPLQKVEILLSKSFESFNLFQPTNNEIYQNQLFKENYALILFWFLLSIIGSLVIFIICKGINWAITHYIVFRVQSTVYRPLKFFLTFAWTSILAFIAFILFFTGFSLILKSYNAMIINSVISLLITSFLAEQLWSSPKKWFSFTKEWMKAYLFSLMLIFGVLIAGFSINNVIGFMMLITVIPFVQQYSRTLLISTINC
ncbi:hypothetical protein HYV79_05270 [Candidatus Woesearchaeota archaeon]|nr:hypothetical protein [Candidatus Woesearchaeota archaeon]